MGIICQIIKEAQLSSSSGLFSFSLLTSRQKNALRGLRCIFVVAIIGTKPQQDYGRVLQFQKNVGPL